MKIGEIVRKGVPKPLRLSSQVILGDWKWGLEFELENIRDTHDLGAWNQVRDDSLRNRGSEFVLAEPKGPRGVTSALRELSKSLKEKEEVSTSQCCSTHVHMDVRGMEVDELFKFMTLYTVFEDALIRSNGEFRQNNLYCLSMSNAEVQVDLLNDIRRDPQYLNHLDDGNYKYAACNLASMNRYGSLEFRMFKGFSEPTDIIPYMNILAKIRIKALEYGSVDDILAKGSADLTGLFNETLEGFQEILADSFDPDEAFEGLMRAQFFNYSGVHCSV